MADVIYADLNNDYLLCRDNKTKQAFSLAIWKTVPPKPMHESYQEIKNKDFILC